MSSGGLLIGTGWIIDEASIVEASEIGAEREDFLVGVSASAT